MSQIQTAEASSPNLRERFSVLGAMISESHSSSWTVEPVGDAHRPAKLHWARADGVVVSYANMSPLRLTNNLPASKKQQCFYAYTANEYSFLRIAGREPIIIPPEEVIILNSGLRHEWVMKRPYDTSCLIIDDELFREYIHNADDLVGRRLRLDQSIQDILRSTIDAAWSTSCAGMFEVAGPHMARSFLELLAIESVSALRPQREEPCRPRNALDFRRDQVKTFVRRHFSNPELSIDMIARQLQLTPRYVQLAFAAEQTTPGEFIRQLWLEQCAKRLTDEAARHSSITEIAFACGFNSSSHFSTQFRKEFGMSPRDYRYDRMRSPGLQ